MPRASICKRRIETCARGMRWVRPVRASTEVEPLRAGPATDSPSPEAASVARVGLASKRLEDTPGDVPEPSPLRCSESPRTGGPASDATQPLSHRGAALATGRSDGLPSCSPHLLHLETSARGLGRPSSNRVTVEMGPSTPTPLAPSARPEAETLARSRRFCHLLAPRARDRRVTDLARPEAPPWRKDLRIRLGSPVARRTRPCERLGLSPSPAATTSHARFRCEPRARLPGREESARDASRRSSGLDDSAETLSPMTPSPLATEDPLSTDSPAKGGPEIRGRGAFPRVTERPAGGGRGRWPQCALGREMPASRRTWVPPRWVGALARVPFLPLDRDPTRAVGPLARTRRASALPQIGRAHV